MHRAGFVRLGDHLRRHVVADELTGLLAAAGFSAVQLYGSLSGAPYDQTAQRLVTVATK